MMPLHLPTLVLALVLCALACCLIFAPWARAEESRIVPDLACPSSPNCVSSLATSAARYVAPFDHLAVPPERARELLLAVLNEAEGVIVVEAMPEHIRAEARTELFGFVDDLVFLLEEQRIQVRSKSRVGYWDLGANRKRVERLRRAFTAKLEALTN